MRRILALSLLCSFTHPLIADDEALLTCLMIKEPDRRVACYDRLAERVKASQEALDTRTGDTTPSQPEVAPRVAPEALFGKSEEQSVEAMQQELGVTELDSIEAKITEVISTAHGKLVVTLDNGQVWRQLDSARLPLRAGDAIVVRSARFGSYILEKQTGSVTIRVKRIDDQ